MRTRFIVATRHDEDAFFRRSLLAHSLTQLSNRANLLLEPAFESATGLAAVYNPAIERSQPGDQLVFVHDDVAVDDWHLDVRLQQGLSVYDVIGVAGATVRQPDQPAWWATEAQGQLHVTAPEAQSGAIRHVTPRKRRAWARLIESGLANLPLTRNACREQWNVNADGTFSLKPPSQKGTSAPASPHAGRGTSRLDVFGPTPAAVKLLDGVFIAARADRLKESAVRFDPRLTYHFYDLDFCRQCEAAGLSMGTWPIALTHGSLGSWGDAWRKSKNLYLEKWRS